LPAKAPPGKREEGNDEPARPLPAALFPMRFLTLPNRRTVAVLAPDAHGIPGVPAAIIPFSIPARRRRPYVRMARASHATNNRKDTLANG
jgi:hypothetical protein